MQIDPTGHHQENGAHMERVPEACGILPVWAFPTLTKENITMRDSVCDSYQFPIVEMKGATIDPETGEHNYPEDPPMYPYMKLTLGDETMWIYPHAIVAFQDGIGQTFVTRMD